MVSSRKGLVAVGVALCMVAPLANGHAATPVGVTSAVNPDARAQRPGSMAKTITLGDEVVHNQVIDTSGEGLVQILLADGTTFTVGPNSSLTIDSFVYDPDAGTAKVTASLSKGFMRFIGGRTSKTPDGATINTPIGTAGIRGAVVDIDLGKMGQQSGGKGRGAGKARGGQGDGEAPPHVSLIFGHEVTLSANGISNRLFKAGYSITVDGGEAQVIRTPPSFLRSMQDQLAGRPGTTGGAASPPGDQTVRGSGIDRHNSGSPIASNIPVPLPRPANLPEKIVEAAQTDSVERAAEKAAETPGGTPTAAIRVLTSRDPADGGGNGILGGSAETDRHGSLTGADGSDGTATLNDSTTLTLPVYADSAFSSHAISGVAYGGSSYSGLGYVGLEGFRAYMLTSGADPLYVIAGTPTANVSSAFSSSGTRHYSLTADALNALTTGAGAAIPFASGPGLSGVDMSGAQSSDFLVAATPANSNPDIAAKGLQAWLVIDGTGAGQKSAIGVMTGSIERLSDGVSYGFVGNRGGSQRLDASDGSVASYGTVASAAGSGGGTSIFGSNGQNLVLTNDLDDANATFRDSPNFGMSLPIGDTDFSTAHVANLVSTDQTASQSYAGKTLTGYNSVARSLNGAVALKAGTVSMTFNGTNGTFSAAFKQFDDDGNLYNDEIGFTDRYGGAVYLDDTAFASSGSNHRSYVVNSALVPAKIFDGGTSSALCSCSYLSWGWWGEAENADGYVTSSHMGNWVIGDVTANIDMPASGTATYSGHAVGTVLNGGSQYIATGDMAASVNFASHTGNVAISDFDGRSFGSNVSFAGSSTFTGANGATSLTGSFVNGNGLAAEGLIGAFTTADGLWSASGIFAGDRN
jgi:hypothetical protein